MERPAEGMAIGERHPPAPDIRAFASHLASRHTPGFPDAKAGRHSGPVTDAADDVTAWVTALVWPQHEGPPTFMGDLSTYRLRPTQSIRRQGLALSWTEPLRAEAPELDAVSVTLTNTSGSVWTPDPEDHGFVHGHFLDDDGNSPAHCSFAYGLSPHEFKGVSLAPGESLQLPVAFSHDKAAAPGSHPIEAILVSLNLRSPKGTLEVVADSDETP